MTHPRRQMPPVIQFVLILTVILGVLVLDIAVWVAREAKAYRACLDAGYAGVDTFGEMDVCYGVKDGQLVLAPVEDVLRRNDDR